MSVKARGGATFLEEMSSMGVGFPMFQIKRKTLEKIVLRCCRMLAMRISDYKAFNCSIIKH